MRADGYERSEPASLRHRCLRWHPAAEPDEALALQRRVIRASRNKSAPMRANALARGASGHIDQLKAHTASPPRWPNRMLPIVQGCGVDG